MNKNQINKLKVMLMGVSSRLEENLSFFQQISLFYQSGAKIYEGVVMRQDNAYALSYNGEIITFTSQELFGWIPNECSKYDSLKLVYAERGYELTLIADDKNVKTTKKETAIEPIAKNPLLTREYIIKPNMAANLLVEIGIMTKEHKIKNDMIRKYNQIDRFIELIEPMFDYDKEELIVLDCCCGKSYLSFVINFYLREIKKKKCKIIGIDIKENVIAQSKRIAHALGYQNMEFLCEDVSCYAPTEQLDMVLSLHACDIATDLAIALGVRSEAQSIVCVPCCHKELKDKIASEHLAPALNHGIFQTRFNDLMTDAMRALKMEEYGYDVDVIEYISPLDTPKNIMIKGKKSTSYVPTKGDAYEKLARYLGGEPSILRQYIYPMD